MAERSGKERDDPESHAEREKAEIRHHVGGIGHGHPVCESGRIGKYHRGQAVFDGITERSEDEGASGEEIRVSAIVFVPAYAGNEDTDERTNPEDGGDNVRADRLRGAIDIKQPAVTKAMATFENPGLVTITPHPSGKRSRLVQAIPAADRLSGAVYRQVAPDRFRGFNSLDGAETEHFGAKVKVLGQGLNKT